MYRLLDWDRELFGFGVALLTRPRLDADALAAVARELRAREVRLIYWPTDPDHAPTQEAARRHGATLADRKTTYVREVPTEVPGPPPGIEIAPYPGEVSCPELDDLAVASGEHSRFARDPRVPRARFEELYRAWLANSLAGEQAEGVLVAREGHDLRGFVTVGEKTGRGDIGLIAVTPRARGRALGTALVHAALAWARERGHELAQVVTQGDNLAACRLYERCGYRRERVENYYHLWLETPGTRRG